MHAAVFSDASYRQQNLGVPKTADTIIMPLTTTAATVLYTAAAAAGVVAAALVVFCAAW